MKKFDKFLFMDIKNEIIDSKTVVTVYDEVKEFYRMNDERDYRVTLNVDGKDYDFTALKSGYEGASVSLVLFENTNKITKFNLIITFPKVVSIKP